MADKEKAWITKEELEKDMRRDLEKEMKKKKEKMEQEIEEKKKKEEKKLKEKKEDIKEKYLELKAIKSGKDTKKKDKKHWGKIILKIFIWLIILGLIGYVGYVNVSNYISGIKIEQYNLGGQEIVDKIVIEIDAHGGIKIDLNENRSIVLTEYNKELDESSLILEDIDLNITD